MTFTPAISLTRALTDPALFGKTFAAPSFWTWRVVAKIIDGLPLTEQREIDLYKECTGRKYDRQIAQHRTVPATDRSMWSPWWQGSFRKRYRRLARCIVRRLATIHLRW
jgi:hypothetical protein